MKIPYPTVYYKFNNYNYETVHVLILYLLNTPNNFPVSFYFFIKMKIFHFKVIG